MSETVMSADIGRPTVDVYPVGLLGDIKSRRVRQGFRYLRYQLKARNWRAVRNYFNGYLAEPSFTNLIVWRCGHGWTKRRALARLGRYLYEANGSTR